MVELTNVQFSYSKTKTLFNNLNMHLKAGNIYGLLGKNGAGKTTLLKIIIGLLFPQKGMCKVLGYKPQDRLPQFNREVYFISEEFYTPSQSFELFLKINAPFYPNFDSNRFYKYLKEFDLQSGSNIAELSYGQKKKFLLSFGLATGCKLLVFDEPTNGLDIPSKSQFRKVLLESVTDEQICLISTHQVRDMANLIDPIIIIDEGDIIYKESIETISQHIQIQLTPEIPEGEDILYWEQTLGGYAVVSKNKTGEETQMDIELLFNMVIKNKNKLGAILEKEDVHNAD